jgi:putative aldouronate transport system permease protein
METQIKPDKGTLSFSVIGYSVMTVITLLCLIPFWLVIAASFSDEQDVLVHGFRLWPSVFSLDAYKSIFSGFDSLMRSYVVTIFITLAGTFTSILLTSMAGYVLIRQDFGKRNAVSFFIYFTTLFSGGVIPSYILFVKYLNMKNSIWALVLPCLLSPWNIFLMRNFMKSIPYSLVEASKIDGANDWQIYAKVMLPLSKAGLATVGLFLSLNYWNDWYHASLYITKESLYPLQYLLYRMLSNAEYMKQAAEAGIFIDSAMPPSETLKMATALVVTGPILLVYPFVQRFFIKGIMIGSVKG